MRRMVEGGKCRDAWLRLLGGRWSRVSFTVGCAILRGASCGPPRYCVARSLPPARLCVGGGTAGLAVSAAVGDAAEREEGGQGLAGGVWARLERLLARPWGSGGGAPPGLWAGNMTATRDVR